MTAMLVRGPFQTEQDALAALNLIHGPNIAEHSRHTLFEACALAGVELGAYDQRVLNWLATYEPQTVASLAGVITRAAQNVSGGRPAGVGVASGDGLIVPVGPTSLPSARPGTLVNWQSAPSELPA